MANIGFFENAEWSSASFRLSAALNLTGSVVFVSNFVEFIFQRRLIAYNVFGYYTTLPNSIRVLMDFVALELIIAEPANVSAEMTLSISFPVGGTEGLFLANRITLPGNQTAVSILPVPVKRFNFEISMQDVASVGNALTVNICFWWETKKIKFVGD